MTEERMNLEKEKADTPAGGATDTGTPAGDLHTVASAPAGDLNDAAAGNATAGNAPPFAMENTANAENASSGGSPLGRATAGASNVPFKSGNATATIKASMVEEPPAGAPLPPGGHQGAAGFSQGMGGTPPYPGMVWGVPYVFGEQPKKPWRKRHPVLFWLGLILLLLVAGNIGFAVAKGPFGGPKIAVVDIRDIILESEKVVNWIETIRRDTSVKSVVIRVNSPGGAVSPSQEIYYAIKRLASEKPVVVSMGALAASGGYYVALGGNEIFANPSTLTASIGVKMQVPNIQGLMQTIGISEKTLSTGALKDAGNISREMSPPEEAYFQELMTDMFEEFVETVIKERHLSREAVLAVADGRAMTGRQAYKAKLVDHLGDYQDAMARATALGNFEVGKTPEVILGPVEKKTLVQEAMGAMLEIQGRQHSATAQLLFLY